MKKTLLAVDMAGKCYRLTNKDGREGYGRLMAKAYNHGIEMCIITDGRCMWHPKFESWHAPAYVHAINPDARIGRTVQDCVKTIEQHHSLTDIVL